MSLKLPNRYEDLDPQFRARLRPNRDLIELTKKAFKSIELMGGLRFLPIFGLSGAGKTSAALELSTHLPNVETFRLTKEEIENPVRLRERLIRSKTKVPTIFVIDQFEEVSTNRERLPGDIIEALSILDRDPKISGKSLLILWLTTSEEFRDQLVEKTTRNTRILLTSKFTIDGPEKGDWPSIILETFREHNSDQQLENFEIIESDLEAISLSNETLGDAIKSVGETLFSYITAEHDLSEYRVMMLWPVTDGLRITRVSQFSDPRLGYVVDWANWYKTLNAEDRQQLPIKEYNRTRLYFDMRIIPIAVADIEPLCANPHSEDYNIPKTYLERFSKTHFVKLLQGKFNDENFAPLRERESKRAENARRWYETITTQPTFVGKRIARALKALGFSATYEESLKSRFGQVRADVFVNGESLKFIIELKCFSPENTMPSTVAEQVKITMRRHAVFAGFLRKQ